MTPKEQTLLHSLNERVKLLELLVHQVKGVPYRCNYCPNMWWQRTPEAFKRSCPECKSKDTEQIQ